MLSISSIAGGGSNYYLNETESRSSYYLDDNSRTYWGGGAKEALGLKGEVKKADFDRLMAGYVTGGERIGNACKENGWKHDAGRDFTFSDPKSVSILLQGPLRPQMQQIKRDALETAMSYGETHFAETRMKGDIVGNQKMVWAAVNEDTSRANDPNGHAHVVVFNILQGEDGKFRAMHNPKFYDNQVLLGQIYRNEVAKGIKGLGFTIEPTGKHGQWEIQEIPQDIRESFSKRRQAILEKINPNNDTAKARENICLITRPSKQNILRARLNEKWSADLKSHGTSFEKLSKPNANAIQKTPYSLVERVRTTSDIIAETNTHVGQYKLYSQIMDRTDGHFTIGDITAEVNQQVTKGRLVRSTDGNYIARSIDQRREKQLGAELMKGHLQSKPLLSEKQYQDTIKGTTLKGDQKAGIRLLTRTPNRYTKIQGDAGSGKTFSLETAVPAIQANGYKVIGLSTTSESTDVLKQTGVFDKVMTFQKYLMVPQGDRKTVLVIDEASMIGRDDMLSLLDYTNKKGLAHVLFQGDANQMSGVKAGMPFKDLEMSGVRSINMNEIIRQKDERHRKGVSELARGNIKQAFKTLKPEIMEVPSNKMTDYAIKAWRATGNPNTPIIIQTNKQKNEINAAIKSEQLKSSPAANHLTLKTWQAVHKTDTEKGLVESYQDATHIRFDRDYVRFSIKSGTIYKIDSIDKEMGQLHLSKQGKSRTFSPAKFKMGKGAIELYRQEERTLHEGDRIRFTRGGKRQPVNNNQYGKVKAINGGKVTFELDKKTAKDLTLSLKDNHIRHIDHAWASTAHAYQGKTVDHAIVAMPSRNGPLTTLESLYTGSSRHKLSVTIVTDNVNKLMTNIKANLQMKELKANIKWPEVELKEATLRETRLKALEAKKEQLAAKPDKEKIKANEAKQEPKKEISQSQSFSMGM